MDGGNKNVLLKFEIFWLVCSVSVTYQMLGPTGLKKKKKRAGSC